jgi:hypothetical protein
MLVMTLIDAVLGLAFAVIGYLIFIKKKYSLINGFDAAFREGRKTERYARRVGLVELVLGILLLIASVISLFFL